MGLNIVRESYDLTKEQIKFLKEVKANPLYKRIQYVYMCLNDTRYFFFQLKNTETMTTKEENTFTTNTDTFEFLNIDYYLDSDDADWDVTMIELGGIEYE